MKGFEIQMKEIFQRPGQEFSKFMDEMKALSLEDKKWYHAELLKSGYECSEPGI